MIVLGCTWYWVVAVGMAINNQGSFEFCANCCILWLNEKSTMYSFSTRGEKQLDALSSTHKKGAQYIAGNMYETALPDDRPQQRALCVVFDAGCRVFEIWDLVANKYLSIPGLKISKVPAREWNAP